MSGDDDPRLPRLTHSAEARAQLAAHLAARGLPHNYREELAPGSQIRWVTWGDTKRVFRSSPAGGEEFSFSDSELDTIVQAVYGRPLTWQVHLLLDARFGGWLATDVVTIVWDFKLGCGKASIAVPVTQTITIVTPGPTNFTEFRAPYAAQTLNIQPVSVHLSASNAGDRQLAWSAWVAPYVE